MRIVQVHVHVQAAMVDLVRDSGGRVLLVLEPTFSAYMNRGIDGAEDRPKPCAGFHAAALEVGALHGAPVVDGNALFARGRAGTFPPFKDDSVHLNAWGHRLLGSELAAEIARMERPASTVEEGGEAELPRRTSSPGEPHRLPERNAAGLTSTLRIWVALGLRADWIWRLSGSRAIRALAPLDGLLYVAGFSRVAGIPILRAGRFALGVLWAMRRAARGAGRLSAGELGARSRAPAGAAN